MNDPHYRLIYLLLFYLQYVLFNNSASISVILYSFCHIVRQEKQLAAMKRKLKVRIRWSEFQNLLSGKQFRRYFRMEKLCFKKLCKDIERAVGEEVFLSEKFLREEIHQKKYIDLKKMNDAHKDSTGGFISGEVRLAITLRLLSGASYLDLGLLFITSYSHVYDIYHYVIKYWINNDDVISIDFYKNLTDVEAMKQTAKEFAVNGRNESIIGGAIAALDGWLVKIKCPTLAGDKVKNQGSFFCQKDYFAVNVQAMVDRKKRVVWRSIKCRESKHDSTAFKRSSLYKLLVRKSKFLMELGLYILGDSAYAIRPFLLTPYNNSAHGTAEDVFNFHHSSCRIFVECAFGEIDTRWGILWSPLRFSLEHNINTIDATMRLHNYIVNYDLKHNIRKSPSQEYDDDVLQYMRAHPGDVVGVFGDNQQETLSGIQRNINLVLKRVGEAVRNKVKDKLHRVGLSRPHTNWFRHQTGRIVIN